MLIYFQYDKRICWCLLIGVVYGKFYDLPFNNSMRDSVNLQYITFICRHMNANGQLAVELDRETKL